MGQKLFLLQRIGAECAVENPANIDRVRLFVSGAVFDSIFFCRPDKSRGGFVLNEKRDISLFSQQYKTVLFIRNRRVYEST